MNTSTPKKTIKENEEDLFHYANLRAQLVKKIKTNGSIKNNSMYYDLIDILDLSAELSNDTFRNINESKVKSKLHYILS